MSRKALWNVVWAIAPLLTMLSVAVQADGSAGMVILDSSGSMDDSDPDEIRAEALKVLWRSLSHEVGSRNHLGIVTFPTNWQWGKFQLVDTEYRKEWEIPNPKGGTEFAPSLAKAKKQLLSEGMADKYRYVVIISDGMASDAKESRRLVEELAAAEVTVHTVFLNAKLRKSASKNMIRGRENMKGLSRSGGGECFLISHPEELVGAMRRIRGEVQGTEYTESRLTSIVLPITCTKLTCRWQAGQDGSIRLPPPMGGSVVLPRLQPGREHTERRGRMTLSFYRTHDGALELVALPTDLVTFDRQNGFGLGGEWTFDPAVRLARVKTAVALEIERVGPPGPQWAGAEVQYRVVARIAAGLTDVVREAIQRHLLAGLFFLECKFRDRDGTPIALHKGTPVRFEDDPDKGAPVACVTCTHPHAPGGCEVKRRLVGRNGDGKQPRTESDPQETKLPPNEMPCKVKLMLQKGERLRLLCLKEYEVEKADGLTAFEHCGEYLSSELQKQMARSDSFAPDELDPAGGTAVGYLELKRLTGRGLSDKELDGRFIEENRKFMDEKCSAPMMLRASLIGGIAKEGPYWELKCAVIDTRTYESVLTMRAVLKGKSRKEGDLRALGLEDIEELARIAFKERQTIVDLSRHSLHVVVEPHDLLRESVETVEIHGVSTKGPLRLARGKNGSYETVVSAADAPVDLKQRVRGMQTIELKGQMKSISQDLPQVTFRRGLSADVIYDVGFENPREQ